MKKSTLAVFVVSVSFTLFSVPTSAQIKSQTELDIGAARQEAQDRRDAANAQNRASSQSTTRADTPAEIEQRNAMFARQREQETARYAQMDEYAAAAAARRAAYIDSERQKSWLAEVADLEAHPAPVAAPGSFTECDRLAASPSDDTRPLGLTGVEFDAIDKAPALAACRAEIARSPQSARAHLELGRVMLEVSRTGPPTETITCAEAIEMLSRAETLGSGKAAHVLAWHSPTDCLDTDIAYQAHILKAVELGNPDAAIDLGVIYSRESRDMSLTTAQRAERTNLMEFVWKKAVRLFAPRAEAGDMYAIFRLATMADNKSMSYFVFDVIQEPNHWVYKCQARRYKACEGFTPKST